LLLVDVDKFKSYNDTRGHIEGDNVLADVGKVIAECTRENVDMGFRYGGDEFTILLPEAGEKQAHRVATRIIETFEARNFDLLTLSLGQMTYDGHCSPKDFMHYTDSMMYEAKRDGGNQVYVYRPKDKAVSE
jgi:diguanylate cyclase (GGDEF)-like protein